MDCGDRPDRSHHAHNTGQAQQVDDATEPEDEAVAHEAAANLWSGFGYQDAPSDVLRMFSQAIEIGYLIALRDVRDGDFDDQITEWRPDLGS